MYFSDVLGEKNERPQDDLDVRTLDCRNVVAEYKTSNMNDEIIIRWSDGDRYSYEFSPKSFKEILSIIKSENVDYSKPITDVIDFSIVHHKNDSFVAIIENKTTRHETYISESFKILSKENFDLFGGMKYTSYVFIISYGQEIIVTVSKDLSEGFIILTDEYDIAHTIISLDSNRADKIMQKFYKIANFSTKSKEIDIVNIY